ncbi:hypothetical protein ABZ038_37805 [Streptomyces sp. NPDC006349]|uniref:hypothetical protein n=1 Tax=Streptomyces sp. NPDC006349 TaxID=3156757 RepID=UPI0006B90356|nr:hypothetical protein ADL35_33145 [Streptomyces sp. NRRL WC-3753]
MAADQCAESGAVLGGQFEAGDSVTLSSWAGTAYIPAHVREPTQQGGDGAGLQGVTRQDFSPNEREALPGGEVGGPQRDQSGDVVGLAGQGVDASQAEAGAFAPAEAGIVRGDHAGEQLPVLEQTGRVRLRVAEQGWHVGLSRHGEAAQGEPALPVLHESSGFRALGVRT